jgi:hypothetical protein
MNNQIRFPLALAALIFVSGSLPAAAQMRAQPVASAALAGRAAAGLLTSVLGLSGAPSLSNPGLAASLPNAALQNAGKALATPGASRPAALVRADAPPVNALHSLRLHPTGALSFDGGANKASSALGLGLNDSNPPASVSFNRPNWDDAQKIEAARRLARGQSPSARELDVEFSAKGGIFQIDDNRNADYFGAFGGTTRNPSIWLTRDLLWRVIQGQTKGAPWEFIAAIIAREQTLSSNWYADIPNSADKLGAAWMTAAKVFVDLTGGTGRRWATDKDFRVDQRDNTSFLMWNTFEKTLDAAHGAYRSGLHINKSEFFRWIAGTMAAKTSNDPAYQFSLWEMHDRHYYRPGDPRDGRPIPADIPSISRTAFDAASQKVYGNDGKGQNSGQNVFGMIINWLRSRGEI